MGPRARPFQRRLSALVDEPSGGLSHEDKAALLRQHADVLERQGAEGALTLRFVPFVPGRRPRDEERHPGLGSSDPVALLNTGRDAVDELVVLMRWARGGAPIAGLPVGARLLASLDAVDPEGRLLAGVEGWQERDIAADLTPIGRGGPSGSADVPSAQRLAIDVESTFGQAPPGLAAEDYLGFAQLYQQRFRLTVEVEVDGAVVAFDEHLFKVFDAGACGSLYRRLLERLLPKDAAQQGRARGGEPLSTQLHPLYPVLSIGVRKAELYMAAILDDLIEEQRRLTDPVWLLEVGIYLEYLTCLGIARAVQNEVDLLSRREWAALESGDLELVRARLEPERWARVWSLREAVPSGTDAPSVLNLLRKKDATLAFLHTHHEDLERAIELTGPNLVNAQESWHRVFRDAERAVLQLNEEVFVELGQLGEKAQQVVLWHQAGSVLGTRLLPRPVAAALGDQDGVFPAACREYRSSMNLVAARAKERGLMEYTGSECIPREASLLEARLDGRQGHLQSLQRRDGYEGAPELRVPGPPEPELALDEVASALAAVEIFDVLAADERARLAASMRPILLGPLERILVQGREGSSLFLLHSGTLQVLVEHDGRDVPVAVLRPPAVVGERAFLTGEPRAATVRALEEAVVLELGAVQLRPLVEARPVILARLAQLLGTRDSERPASPTPSFIEALRARIFGAG